VSPGAAGGLGISDPVEEPVALPGEPEFTLRAVVTGMLLGAVFSTCNIYIGLKIGWGLNLSILAALVGYGYWQAGASVFGTRRFGILENNISQTACSAGASVAGAGLIAAIPAVMMIEPELKLSWLWLSVWIFSVCLVGIVVAGPVRRQLIEQEKLPFATGVATAETLREIYSKSREAALRLFFLGAAAVFASVTQLGASVFEWSFLRPIPIGGAVRGVALSGLGFRVGFDAATYGLGGLVGLRIGFSLLLGGLLGWVVLAPALLHNGVIEAPVSESLEALPEGAVLPEGVSYDATRKQLLFSGIMSEPTRDALLAAGEGEVFRDAATRLYLRSQWEGPAPVYKGESLPRAAVPLGPILRWLVWPATAMIVVASLSTLLASSVGRALSFRTTGVARAQVEWSGAGTRFWLFVSAVVVLSAALQISLFGIAWWAAGLAVLLSFLLAVVAGRVVGETAINPVGPLGKVTQLTFGLLTPASATTNLMTASVTGGAAAQCADLLYDLKCGSMIGASPRAQVRAQIFGALAGSLAGCGVFLVMMNDPSIKLLTSDWPAPAVATWKAFADVFAAKERPLPRLAETGLAVGAGIALLLVLVERFVPATRRAWVPSATSMGMGAIAGMAIVIPIFIGALLMWSISRLVPSPTARLGMIACVGLIAGESITGVGIAFTKIDWSFVTSWFR